MMATSITVSVSHLASGISSTDIYCAAQACHRLPMRQPFQLKQIRERQGLLQSDLAERLGVSNVTISRYETGKRNPDASEIPAIAQALGVDPGDLFKLPNLVPVGPKLSVKGEVAAGVWREATEWPQEDWLSFTGRPDVGAHLDHRFGLRIVGDSMNELYPDGTIVECVSFLAHPEVASGKRVVVVRENDRGEYEATVKELRIQPDGTEWLVPRSTNPAFQTPFQIGVKEPGIVRMKVTAVVVGSYRPE